MPFPVLVRKDGGAPSAEPAGAAAAEGLADGGDVTDNNAAEEARGPRTGRPDGRVHVAEEVGRPAAPERLGGEEAGSPSAAPANSGGSAEEEAIDAFLRGRCRRRVAEERSAEGSAEARAGGRKRRRVRSDDDRSGGDVVGRDGDGIEGTDGCSLTVVVTKPSKDAKLGLGISTGNGAIRITHVEADGLFAGTELKVGMTIESVNGRRYGSCSEGMALLQEAKGELTVVASRASGERSEEDDIDLSIADQTRQRASSGDNWSGDDDSHRGVVERSDDDGSKLTSGEKQNGHRSRAPGSEAEWRRCFERLSRFVREHGTLPSAGATLPDEEANYEWLLLQKRNYRYRAGGGRANLSEESVRRLRRIGVDLDGFGATSGSERVARGPRLTWLGNYENYKAHRDEASSRTLTRREIRKVHQWALNQRKVYRANKMKKSKIALLEEIGFEFATEWEKRFERLSQFVQEHGRIPSANGSEPDEEASFQWLLVQKKIFDSGKFSEEKIHCLNQIEVNLNEIEQPVLLDRSEKVWERWCCKLEAYSQNNCGDANVDRKKDNNLYIWVCCQRKAFREERLSDDRAERLKAIGLDFNWSKKPLTHDLKWESMYSKLVDYHSKHGHCYVPWHYESERHGNLGYWVCQMRSSAAGAGTKGYPLSDEKKKKLLKLGFDFQLKRQLKKHYDDKWENTFEEYIKYKAENGGKDPPSNSRGLGNWLKNQRIKWRIGTLEQDRVDKLKAGHFDFRPLKVILQDEEWHNKFQEFVTYQTANDAKRAASDGDHPRHIHLEFESPNEVGSTKEAANEPPSVGEGLRKWISKQRSSYLKGTLELDRFKRLYKAGFDFRHERWDMMYELLVDFYEENGHCDIGNVDPKLAAWMENMQSDIEQQYLLGEPPSYRMMLLQSIFDRSQTKCWYAGCSKFATTHGLCRNHHSEESSMDAGSEQWKEMHTQLRSFIEENGHRDVDGQNPRLQAWIIAMQENNQLSNIQQQQLKLLEIRHSKGSFARLRRCTHGSCNKFALFGGGRCYTHSYQQQDVPKALPESPSVPKSLRELRARVFEAVRLGKHNEPPEALSQLDFDFENPPEKIREEPSTLVTLDEVSSLGDHDVVFNNTSYDKDGWRKGNIWFRELVDDCQVYYIMAQRHKRRPIAKSLMFIVQKRNGRFFLRDTRSDGRLHQLCDADAINRTMRALKGASGKHKKTNWIRMSALQLLEGTNALDESKERNIECKVKDDKMCGSDDNDESGEIDLPEIGHAGNEESSSWHSKQHALKCYIKQHGHPPKTREDDAELYDWIQLQKSRICEFESLFEP